MDATHLALIATFYLCYEINLAPFYDIISSLPIDESQYFGKPMIQNNIFL